MMMNSYQQRGMSVGSILCLLIMLVLILIVFFKLFPIYMESWKIENILQNLKADEEMHTKEADELRHSLLLRLEQEDIEFINRENIKQFVRIDRTVDGFMIELTYSKTASLMGNVAFLVQFEKTVEAP